MRKQWTLLQRALTCVLAATMACTPFAAEPTADGDAAEAVCVSVSGPDLAPKKTCGTREEIAWPMLEPVSRFVADGEVTDDLGRIVTSERIELSLGDLALVGETLDGASMVMRADGVDDLGAYLWDEDLRTLSLYFGDVAATLEIEGALPLEERRALLGRVLIETATGGTLFGMPPLDPNGRLAPVCAAILLWVGRVVAAAVIMTIASWVVDQSYSSYDECMANLWQCDADAWTKCHQGAPPGKYLASRTRPDPAGYCSWFWSRFPIGYYMTCFEVECTYECFGAGAEGNCQDQECSNPNPECCEQIQKECHECES